MFVWDYVYVEMVDDFDEIVVVGGVGDGEVEMEVWFYGVVVVFLVGVE